MPDENIFQPPIQDNLASQFQTDAWQKLFDWLFSLPTNTMNLIQQNSMYLVIIGILVFLVNKFIISKFVATGLQGWIISFVIVMAISIFWIPAVAGAIK